MKKQNESGNLRHKIVYSKELTALEKRYLLELMMTKQTESNSESEGFMGARNIRSLTGLRSDAE